MAVKTKKVFGYFPSSLNFGFVVKRLLNLKNASRNVEVSLKTEIVLIRVHFTGR